ncbi:Vegetative incompatibility protein HET-E-1 [Lachnellula subtilissima]|uniref:Vegetative incompatibility protein HET-E-1 n=1 Tax=Lachnellula subtilissima TaxID=602034 RepID=A0A8H8RPP0_9HELO|nr:Vegetative incompatibility protein HET-E-1 [Lachnellula subtilissima]
MANFLHPRKKVKISEPSSSPGETTAAAVALPTRTTMTNEAMPLPQKHDLYSTEGPIGMRVIADPDNAILDIVLVHGLMGNRETTWTHTSGFFWPEELSIDVVTARIMTFGYDADVFKLWGTAGSNNLRNHGKNLAYAVSDRRRKSRDRPIIFIAHSLGGLVCEQAILICVEGEKNLEKIFQSTIGIIFMGTPHAGADLAKWGHAVARYLNIVRKTNSAILDVLRRESDVLTSVQQQFQQLLCKRGLEIAVYCFFEERAVVGVGIIVSEQSAVLSQYPNQSISANHMDLAKFSGRNDEGYQRVLNRVQDNIEMMDSFISKFDDPSKPLDYEKRTKCHQLFRTSPYELHKKRNPDPVKGTCQWLLQHNNYINWRDSQNSSLLWVSAYPGCGKSVLSKYLVDKELRATRSRTTCYFFFKDDNEDQKTATNALCALLHQIFIQKPALLKHTDKPYEQNGEQLIQNINSLWNLLITTSQDPQAGEIICILDALDECGRNELNILLPSLCRFYQEIPRSMFKGNLKFLVTSRPYHNIERDFSKLSLEIPTVRLAGEEETDQIKQEINLAIEDSLTNLQKETDLSLDMISSLRQELTKVKHRTYLWLALVMDIIRKDLLSLTKAGRQKAFGKIPVSVDQAYTSILNKSTNYDMAWKLLKIICAAKWPLRVKEITIALTIQENDKTHESLEIQTEGFSKRFIQDLCGLFVIIIKGHVYLLHQTAKEFLMTPDLPPHLDLNSSFNRVWKHSISIQSSNFVLVHSCMWYLRLDELHEKDPPLESDKIFRSREFERELFSKFDFLEYSARSWADHFQASLIPETHSSINFGIEICQIYANRLISWSLSSFDILERPTGSNSLHVASLLGFTRVVCQLIATPGININRQDNNMRTPLFYAAERGHWEIVQALLAVPDINLNSRDMHGQTPLSWAAENKSEAMVKLLLEKTADVDSKDNEGRTPLSWAAENESEAVVKLLLEKTADFHSKDLWGRTSLFRAAQGGYESAVQQLLEKGANVEVKDPWGRTALHRAARFGHEGVVQLLLKKLLEKEGDVNEKDLLRMTALDYADTHRHERVVQLLTPFDLKS